LGPGSIISNAVEDDDHMLDAIIPARRLIIHGI
jgi:hypothetical protein